MLWLHLSSERLEKKVVQSNQNLTKQIFYATQKNGVQSFATDTPCQFDVLM